MRNEATNTWAPAIIVSDADVERLRGLATAVMERSPDIAEDLIAEIERATVLADARVPRTVVRMGSEVEFESDDGRLRRVMLVFPAEADIAHGKISILTPVGTALIGLSEGQSIKWLTRDGHEKKLTVLTVAKPAVTQSGSETSSFTPAK